MILMLLLAQDLLTEEGAKKLASFSSDDRLVISWDAQTGADFAVTKSTEVTMKCAPVLETGDYRSWFSKVPVERWAAIDGRPVVWLAPGATISIDDFRRDFRGRAPFVIATKPPADRLYDPDRPVDHEVMVIGKGERDWYAALKSRPKLLLVREWDEGLVEKFRKGDQIANPKGKWTGQKRVGYNLKYEGDLGVTPLEQDDGLFELVQTVGMKTLSTKENKLGETRHLYFNVDDSYCYWEKRTFAVEIEYLDVGTGTFWLEYDSADPTKKGADRWYRKAGEKDFAGMDDWRTVEFDLRDAWFGNRQKGADFRIGVKGRGIAIRKILIKPK